MKNFFILTHYIIIYLTINNIITMKSLQSPLKSLSTYFNLFSLS